MQDTVAPGEKTSCAGAFRKMIGQLVEGCEQNELSSYAIKEIAQKYGFQKRRLYDVLDVLEVYGALRKTNVDTFVWLGKSNIKSILMALRDSKSDSEKQQIAESTFQESSTISISKLTHVLILLLMNTHSNVIDIKKVSVYFSLRNNRYKTILCKVYQIVHILSAAGIVEKTKVPGMVRFVKEFAPCFEKKIEMPPIDYLLGVGPVPEFVYF